MNRIHLRGASALLALLAVTGCVSTTPHMDSHFGEVVNLVKAQQTLNPDASRNSEPLNGMDGKAAMSAYDEYQKSYRAPEPQQSVFTIGVGGSR